MFIEKTTGGFMIFLINIILHYRPIRFIDLFCTISMKSNLGVKNIFLANWIRINWY